MIIYITMKTPDAIERAIERAVEEELELAREAVNDTTPKDEGYWSDLKEMLEFAARECVQKWFTYNELVTIKVDVQKRTATVMNA